ncbi:hypothetical protein B0T25DRAFT_30956 [Lasiosphaeria hispida]|uniref:Uncharacterized protein n=1 Tax=Lasiosphaeria hispida TaxID=260671 RepID=A0AAJ0HUW4_9PEZI|nr:hypothetical protein B0T25DRAFT_30956 [Lasiosphaeria hispida]
MSLTDKPGIHESERVAVKPRKRGCLGHCIKLWWAYLIGFIVLVILVVCLVIFVGVPKIAQSKLDEAELTIDGIVVTNTQSNQLNMAINSTIRSDGKVHATIAAFVGDMYLEDAEDHAPFARINFPETTGDALQVVNISQILEISDMAAMTTFNTWLLKNSLLRVTVHGDTTVKVEGISKSFPVTFHKTIEMPGLNMLSGLTVSNSSIQIGGDKNGDNFFATVNIPNTSLFTIELGNSSFHNYLLGKEVGTVFIDNLTLVPGNDNKYPIRAAISQNDILDTLGESPYCDKTEGVLPFQLRGKTVVNHGQNITYFADALASANQTVEIDLGTPIKALLGKAIPCGGL